MRRSVRKGARSITRWSAAIRAACSKAKKNPKSGGKLDAGVDYGKMKVQRLRAILSVHGIPCKLCAEKSDFVRAIREAIAATAGEL